MLTEHEVRDLLRLAGDTVEVGPAATPTPVRRRAWPVVAAGVAVAAVIALVFALTGLPGGDREAVDTGPVAPRHSTPSDEASAPSTQRTDTSTARRTAEALLAYHRGGEAPPTADRVDLRWSYDDYTSVPGLPSVEDSAWPAALFARPAVRVVGSAACVGDSPRPDLELAAGARIAVPRDAGDCSAPALHVWVDAAGRIRLIDLAPGERAPDEAPASCLDSDVATFRPGTGDGATGWSIAPFELRTHRPCTLVGTPDVEVVDADGEVMPYRVVAGDSDWVGEITVDASGETSVVIEHYRCDLTPDPPRSAMVRVRLPGLSSWLEAPLEISLCNAERDDSVRVSLQAWKQADGTGANTQGSGTSVAAAFVDWVRGTYAKGTSPFAEGPIELLLGGRRVGTTDALGPDAWTFRCQGGYAGRDCPVFLDPHMFEQELELEAGVADVLCAPMGLDLPPRVQSAEAVSITPAESDCTTGYAVTLWVDEDGRIFAVGLQLAEP